MHQAEYRKEDLSAAYIGRNLLIVNNRTKNYYIERNPYLGKYLLQKFFLNDIYTNFEIIKSYVEQVRKLLYKEVKVINNEYIIYIEITNKCNLCCKHCYNDSNSKNTLIEKELSIDTIKQLIENNLHKKDLKIILSGGEPTLHSQFKQILSLINSYNIPITMYSNGIDVIKNIGYLKKYNVNVMVSLDGASEEYHDYIRGKGSFMKTCHNIQVLFRELGENHIAVAFTINRYNYKTIEEMLSMCRKFGIKRVYINPVAVLGRNKKNDLGMRAEELINMWDNLCFLSKKYDDISVICDTYWKRELIMDNQKIPYDCSMCRKIRVSVTGDVFPCTFFDDPMILKQNIRENSVLFTGNKYEQTIMDAERRKNECQECIYYIFCNGGCAAAGYANGKWGIDQTECEAKGKFFENCIKTEYRE